MGITVAPGQTNGFTLPKPDQTPAQPDPATVARHASERRQTTSRPSPATAAHEHAASEAALLWEQASEAGESAYLEPQVWVCKPTACAFGPDGWLLYSLRDSKLWNLQRIAPARPAGGGTDKLL